MMTTCPECGRQLSDRASTCPGCGFPMGGQGKTPPVKGQGKKKKRRRLCWGAAAVVCAAALLLGRGLLCEMSGCWKRCIPGSAYCASHTCAREGCTNFTGEQALYCSEHSVDFSALLRQREENAAAVLKISNVSVTSNSSYTVCTGTLTNNGKDTYTFVELKGAFQDSTGRVVDTDWTYAVGTEGLSPGESTTFRMSVKKNYSVKTCSVTLLDYDRD